MTSKEEKEQIAKQFGNPIEHILQCLKNNIKIKDFDITNATDQWNTIKNKKLVAFVKENDRGQYYDLTFNYNPYDDQEKVIRLYRE